MTWLNSRPQLLITNNLGYIPNQAVLPVTPADNVLVIPTLGTNMEIPDSNLIVGSRLIDERVRVHQLPSTIATPTLEFAGLHRTRECIP